MGSYKANSLVGVALKTRRKTPLDDIISENNLAEYLGCCEKTIHYYTIALGLPFIAVGRDRYYSMASVANWFKAREKSNPVNLSIAEPDNGNGSKKTPLTKGQRGLTKSKFDPSLNAFSRKGSEIP